MTAGWRGILQLPASAWLDVMSGTGGFSPPRARTLAPPPIGSIAMTFRLSGIDPAPYAAMFALDDEALRRLGAKRVMADRVHGYPCRVSLEDACIGEELLLLTYEHQRAPSPYRACGPVFVRRNGRRAFLAAGVVPPYVTRRLISLRAYDAGQLMVDASVRDGEGAAAELERMFSDPAVACVHLHNARYGCFSCVADRV